MTRQHCREHYERYGVAAGLAPELEISDDTDSVDDDEDSEGYGAEWDSGEAEPRPPSPASSAPRSATPIPAQPELPPPVEPRDVSAPAALPDSDNSRMVRALVLQLLDKKALHHETQQSVAATLSIIRSALAPALGPDLVDMIPRSWHQCMAYIKPHLPKRAVVHCCPNECGVFFVDENEDRTECPTPGCGGQRYSDPKSKTGKPSMVCHVFDLESRLRLRYGCLMFAKLLAYPHTREVPEPGGYMDIQDGSRWREDFVRGFGESKYNIALAISSDSFPIDKHRKRSVTPVIAQILNLPPFLRGKVGAQLLIMMLPNHAKKVDIYMRLFIRSLQQLQLRGVIMWNEHEKKWVRVRCMVLNDNNDLVAAPKISGTKACGSIVGACHLCDVRGLSLKELKTRVYTGAHRFLAADDPLR